MHLVDQVLWAAMAGADEFGGTGVTNTTTTLEGDYTRSTNPVSGVGSNSGLVYDEVGASLPSDSSAVGGLLGFQNSNRSTLPQMTLYFVFETEEHTSELQSHHDLVCRLLLEKKKKNKYKQKKKKHKYKKKKKT